ncbi:hypothetical protein Dimus_037413 [Dionaea muscipula]
MRLFRSHQQRREPVGLSSRLCCYFPNRKKKQLSFRTRLLFYLSAVEGVPASMLFFRGAERVVNARKYYLGAPYMMKLELDLHFDLLPSQLLTRMLALHFNLKVPSESAVLSFPDATDDEGQRPPEVSVYKKGSEKRVSEDTETNQPRQALQGKATPAYLWKEELLN